MSLYSAIQFTSVSFLYASASNLGDFQVCSLRRTVSCVNLTANTQVVPFHRFIFDSPHSNLQYALPHSSARSVLKCHLVGWTGPFSTLCRKRPTASLVSRKVLTPLLGHVALCIVVQSVAFEYVRRQSW